MTLNYGLFDVSDPENPDRVYSAALLSRIVSKHIRDGIVHGDGGELAVSASDPPAMSVQVGTGTAMIRGRFCENDAALTLPVTTAHATYPRFDRVVVRLNASPGRTIDIVVKPGTPAPSPVPPALTRTAETWELSLAKVWVEVGATSILSTQIADERGNASLCGVACPAYVPSSVLEIVGGLTMHGSPLVGLPWPGTSSAATTKAYVDSVISGFGISQIAIDADKNWNGKNITNLGQIDPKRMLSPGDSVLITKGAGEIATFNAQLYGTGYVRVDVYTPGQSGNYDPWSCVVQKNGVTVGSKSQPAHNGGTLTVVERLAVQAGDTLKYLVTEGAQIGEMRVCGVVGLTPYGLIS
jgi:hypothetical protein